MPCPISVETQRLSYESWQIFFLLMLLIHFSSIPHIPSRVIKVDDLGVVTDRRGISRNLFRDNVPSPYGDVISDMIILDQAAGGTDINVIADNRSITINSFDSRELRQVNIVAQDSSVVYDNGAVMPKFIIRNPRWPYDESECFGGCDWSSREAHRLAFRCRLSSQD